MPSLSKYNKGIKYLLCAIDLFSKYAWVIPLKDKKGTSIVNAFQKIITERRKPNKMWVDQGSEFYNQSFKDFLKINNIEMYLYIFAKGHAPYWSEEVLLLIKFKIQFIGLMLLMI